MAKKTHLLDRTVSGTVGFSTLLAAVLAVFFTVSGAAAGDSLQGEASRTMQFFPGMQRMQSERDLTRHGAPRESQNETRRTVHRSACVTEAVETMQASIRAAQEQLREDLETCRASESGETDEE